MPCRISLSPGHRVRPPRRLELERHAGKWVIGIDHHKAVVLVDLGNHHVLRSAVVLALREKTHPRFDLVYTAKLLAGTRCCNALSRSP